VWGLPWGRMDHPLCSYARQVRPGLQVQAAPWPVTPPHRRVVSVDGGSTLARDPAASQGRVPGFTVRDSSSREVSRVFSRRGMDPDDDWPGLDQWGRRPTVPTRLCADLFMPYLDLATLLAFRATRLAYDNVDADSEVSERLHREADALRRMAFWFGDRANGLFLAPRPHN